MCTIDTPYDLSQTITHRRSVRSFKTDPLKPKTLARLSEFAKTVRMPFACDTEIRFFKAEPTKELYKTLKAPVDNVHIRSVTAKTYIKRLKLLAKIADLDKT